MATISLLFTTFFAAVVCGSVLLIRLGGWLAMVAAILILCQFFISLSLITILTVGSMKDRQKQKEKEQKQYEGMGN